MLVEDAEIISWRLDNDNNRQHKPPVIDSVCQIFSSMSGLRPRDHIDSNSCCHVEANVVDTRTRINQGLLRNIHIQDRKARN